MATSSSDVGTAEARLAAIGAIGSAATDYLKNAPNLGAGSRRSYAEILEKLAADFAECDVSDFNPPDGVLRTREFLERHWGNRAPGTFNKAHSTLHSFFKYQIGALRLIADPTPGVPRKKIGMPRREVFTSDEVAAILGANGDLRDNVALRLLLDWGLSKGALQALRIGNFDLDRGLLVARAFAGRQYVVPIPDDEFWSFVDKLITTDQGSTLPRHYLLPTQDRRSTRHGGPLRLDPDQPSSNKALHMWWYRCLERAEIVPPGVTRGESMNKARQTAGQRWLDKTGDLKSVQTILGHASIQTTWTGYSTLLAVGQLADQLSKALEEAAGAE